LKINFLQTSHAQYRPITHNKKLIVLCDGIKSPANLGGLFRICDAFGVHKIISNEIIPIHSRRFIKSARNTNDQIPIQQGQLLTESILQLQLEGFETIGLEITTHSTPIQHFKPGPSSPLALVVGNESRGISDEVLKLLPTVLHIPMYGHNSSMNVIQALAIALFEFTKNE
jgi:tRNA G18 (ribose-2'-O)-methylase SpoU